MSRDLEAWLAEIGLGKYQTVFAENDIDMRALPHLNEEDMRELGMSLGHRKILLAELGKIRGQRAAEAQVEPNNGTISIEAPVDNAVGPNVAHRDDRAERRHLSIVFCDLVGSTSIANRIDPEDFRDLMRRYQDAIAGCVSRNGGHVAKFLGDGVLAYFGWPKAYEDQAERAVRSALEILQLVSELSDPTGERLAARAGIASGEVIVGDLIGDESREIGAVLGDTPNLAARLQDHAQPGKLLIADATRTLIGSTFEIVPAGNLRLKGFDSEVQAFHVTRERVVDSRFAALQGDLLLPFVGRTHELGILQERWDAARTGRGHVVFISGEAGIGKSRLVETFCGGINDGEASIIRMQCSPYLNHSAYHPIIDRWTRAAGLSSDDDAASQLRKLEEFAQSSGENLERVIPIYAELMSVQLVGDYKKLELPPQALRDLTQQTLVDRVLQMSEAKPVIVLVEDAHWIDPSTSEVLDRAAARIQPLPILIVITHRPEWTPDWAASYSHCSTVSIGRIDRGHIAELVEAVIDDPPDSALLNDVVSRTDGVPLFVVELARAVKDAKRLGNSDARHVPATLQASLMARLDGLEPETRSVVQVASILGRDFDRELLAKVVGRSLSEIEDALHKLMQSQIITRSAVAIDGLSFRHALIQETAYQSLLASRRRSYHEIVGETISNNYSDIAQRQPELVAYHFSEADRFEDALPFWKQAARNALDKSAHFEAIGHSERAAKAAGNLRDEDHRDEEFMRTGLLLAQSLAHSGNLAEAMEKLTSVADRARDLRDAAAFAEAALLYDGTRFIANLHDDKSAELLSEALSMLGSDNGRERCQVLGRLARSHLMLGNREKASIFNDQAVEQARSMGDQLALFDALVNDMLMPTEGRSSSESEQRNKKVQEILSAAEAADDNECRSRANALNVYFAAEIGERDRLDQALNAQKKLGEDHEMLHIQWIASHGLAMQAMLDGDFDAAERLAEAAFELGQQTHGDNVEGVYGMQMFSIRREQGRLSEVAPIIKRFIDEDPKGAEWKPGFALIAGELGYTEQAARMLSEIGADGYSFPLDAKRSTTLAYLADVCASVKDEQNATALYELLLPYQDMTITAGVMTVCYGSAGRYLGQLATVLGDWAVAEEHFLAAQSMNERMRAWPWLAHNQFAYSQMLMQRVGPGDAELAAVLRQNALETARQLGMVALEAKLLKTLH